MKWRAAGLFAISIALALVSLPPALAAAGSVYARFDLSSLQGGPFPSNRFTVADSTQNTGLRVDLPKPMPDCAAPAPPSDCSDIDVLNKLDGFNLQPRLSIPFDGPIDVGSVTSKSVFLVNLGSTLPGEDPGGEVVGINQVVWDTFTNTLSVESDALLDQHTRYVLVVTRSLLDESGKHVKAAKEFLNLVNNENGASTVDPALDEYRKSLRDALTQIDAAGIVPLDQIVAASIFTTQSATAVLEKIRDQIKAATPAPADLAIGTNGERAVFPLAEIASGVFTRQVATAPKPSSMWFSTSDLIFDPLHVVETIGTVASGRYLSPNYETDGGSIPPIGTLSGTPSVHGMNEVYFLLFLPAGPAPPRGWPVAIVGHGGGAAAGYTTAAGVAAKFAEQGIATIAINAVGFFGGSLGTITLSLASGDSVTFPVGGRGIDQNRDGIFGAEEGFSAVPPRTLIGSRDGLTQTVADLMQLVRVIEVGIDVDGDSAADLDASHISYIGSSLGGNYGVDLAAVDPGVRASFLNVAGGPGIDIVRVSSRPFLGQFLATRVPSLLNGGPDPLNPTNPFPFNENLPRRNQTPVLNDIPGAIEIQELIDRVEWAMQSSNPVAYARHLRRNPLSGGAARPVLFSFAKGDKNVPNPTTSAILRAGQLADRTTYFRNDIAFALNPAINKNPHLFLSSLGGAGRGIALAAQEAAARFLASDGQVTVDPDGVGTLFETPIAGPLPEDLSFIT
jgi:Bacterial virulence factor lipase N-terminal